MMLPRDLAVVVPESIYESLKTMKAIKTSVVRDKESGGMVTRVAEAPKYSISATRIIN